MSNEPRTVLSSKLKAKHELSRICNDAINKQIERGEAEAMNLRNRRRQLVRRVLKQCPYQPKRQSLSSWLKAVAVVLAMWGFVTTGAETAQAQASFVQQTGVANPLNAAAAAIPAGYMTPAFADIDNDGDMDAFIGSASGRIAFFENIGSALNPSFIERTGAANPVGGVQTIPYIDAYGYTKYSAAANLADIDNDGDMDLFVGNALGNVEFFRNVGTPASPIFVKQTGAANPLAAVAVPHGTIGTSAAPALVDIDSDGDLDAFVGGYTGGVYFFRNTGTATSAVFTPVVGVGNPLNLITGYNSTPAFVDIDSDGDMDAFDGGYSGSPLLLNNTGTPVVPVFTPGGYPFAITDYNLAPSFVDIDNDGDMDAFIGMGGGYTTPTPYQVAFFKNVDPTPIAVNDTATTTSTIPVTTGDVTANDAFKVEGPAASFSITAFDAVSANGGTVVNNGNKTFTYTAVAGFSGPDSFTYTLSDGAGNSATGTVIVTVVPDNISPVITAPANITVTATGPSGIPATDAAVAAFLNGATANDNVDGVLPPTNNAPAIFPVGATTVTFSATDAAGNTGTATATVTVTAPLTPLISLSLNSAAFRTNNTMTLTASTLASAPVANADIYVALKLPDGTLLVMQPNGSFSTALTPLLSNVPVPDFTGPIFNFTFSGTEPPGNYTWFAVLTTPGSLNIIGTLATASFSFAP